MQYNKPIVGVKHTLLSLFNLAVATDTKLCSTHGQKYSYYIYQLKHATPSQRKVILKRLKSGQQSPPRFRFW